jgi:hypothetical protein
MSMKQSMMVLSLAVALAGTTMTPAAFAATSGKPPMAREGVLIPAADSAGLGAQALSARVLSLSAGLAGTGCSLQARPIFDSGELAYLQKARAGAWSQALRVSASGERCFGLLRTWLALPDSRKGEIFPDQTAIHGILGHERAVGIE